MARWNMIYIGSPYSHPDPEVRQQRYEQVAELTAWAIKNGYIVYSPINHCHPLAVKYELPKGFDFWKKFDLHILGRCDRMWVYQMEGWDESIGLKEEIEFAKGVDIPIHYFSPEELNNGVVL